MYIGAVVLLGVVAFSVAVAVDGLQVGWEFVAFLSLAVVVLLAGDVVVEGAVRLSLSGVLILGGLALLGPAGAGLLGALLGALEYRKVPWRARVFNAAQVSTYASLGGLAFLLTGGSTDPAALRTIWGVARVLLVPLLAADVVVVLVNLLLVAGVVQLTAGVPIRNQVGQLLGSVGVLNVGYGFIALLLVLLWSPAGMGPSAVLIVIAPLLVAQWAYRQHAEELSGQERALEVLVAAIEAKAPHLTGHSARVAELSAFMAESLGLRAQSTADARVAGMLHDVGQTSLPTAVVRGADASSPALADYPARSVGILVGLTFLDGSLAPIGEHRLALDSRLDATTLPGGIVGLADAYDLLTEVGTHDGRVLPGAEALVVLRGRAGVDDSLLRALDAALARRAAGAHR